MARRQHHFRLQSADPEALAIRKQPVPLRSIGAERVGQIVNGRPELVHFHHSLAESRRYARTVLQVPGSRQMVGKRMRVQDPLQSVIMLLDVEHQRVAREPSL